MGLFRRMLDRTLAGMRGPIGEQEMSAFDQALLGNAPEFRSVLRTAQIAAAVDVTMLLLGESGTGKELLAEAIHRESRRAKAAFVPVNCAALPESLAESELFGHRKGAFTGAIADKAGLITSADGGTLFLDEIGELPLSLQAKLLRFIENGEILPVGAQRPLKVNVRLIAATNRDLNAEVKAGRFRADLYYRLNVVPVELPPLRQRSGDAALLIEALMRRFAASHGLAAPMLTPAARKALEAYSWPGNVRELRNFCERITVLFSGRNVDVTNLPSEMQAKNASNRSAGLALPAGGIDLEAVELDFIRQALEATSGNRTRAARLLGLTRDTLLYRIKKFAL
jgi:transcriptional regulator with PAS, ATPase and Fis domain